MIGDRQDLGDHDLDVVRADACRDTRQTTALVHPGGGRELAVAVLVLDRVEELGDLGRAVLIAGKQDVFG